MKTPNSRGHISARCALYLTKLPVEKLRVFAWKSSLWGCRMTSKLLLRKVRPAFAWAPRFLAIERRLGASLEAQTCWGDGGRNRRARACGAGKLANNSTRITT